MIATQHGGTLRRLFIYYITIKIMLGFFHEYLFFKSVLAEAIGHSVA
jgi:hypothetical protein